MVCLETREQMPALPDEWTRLCQKILPSPIHGDRKRIIVNGGRVTGVEFKKCVSVFDENGRFNPSYDENITTIIEADHVLVSIGQSIEWGGLLDGSSAELNNRTIKADSLTYQTGQRMCSPAVTCTPARFAIDAIAAGKRAAISIHRFVHPGQKSGHRA